MTPYFHIRTVVTLFSVTLWFSPQFASIANAQTASPDRVWQAFDKVPAARADTQILIRPTKFKTFTLNAGMLRSKLATAPMEFTPAAQSGGRVEVTLPTPDGKMARFLAEESPIMEAPLAARYPDIKTYRAQGIDDPAATARFGLTPSGFHAIILSPLGAYYIDPYRRGDAVNHLSYFKRDLERTNAHTFECQLLSPDGRKHTGLTAESASTLSPSRANGETLRTYRLALAANFEYSDFHSDAAPIPDKAQVLANGIVPTVNRVVGIYEREVAVRMVLVQNEDLIIFNTPADPYVNEEGLQMLAANQATCDAIITPIGYDIGHVVSTGGGGVAFLGVVCSAQKAGGVTGLPSPTGDAFYVDYVAHEMGHQFGGSHTFNGNISNCAGGNRTASTAYEPGSGSTIQAYAGICPPQDLQLNSDAYFHTISYDEILDHITGTADSCAAKTNTGNAPPTIEAGPNFNIPARTPFTLTAVASDANGDVLSYDWEEFDLGPATNGQIDNGTSPIFRSYNPTTSPSRMFPSQQYVLNNANTPPLTYPCGPTGARTCLTGELLPTMTRALKFRVTARDNRAGGGGVVYDNMQVNVTNTSAPFIVTVPNGGETWASTTPQTVTWDVAGTAAAPISAANVDIHLSIDGGQTFPIVLATGVVNDGSHAVALPSLSSSQARVRVTGSGNIFFDISNANFTISTPPPQLTSVVSRKTHGINPANTFNITLPLTGPPYGIESRSGGLTNDYTLVFTFSSALASVDSATVSAGAVQASSAINRDNPLQYILEITGVTTGQYLTATLNNVNGSGTAAVTLGVLVGDVAVNGIVSNTDVSAVKGQISAPVTASNFRSDVNANGIVSNTDVSATKAQISTTLP